MKKKKITPKKKFFYWFIPLIFIYLIFVFILCIKTPFLYTFGIDSLNSSLNFVGFELADSDQLHRTWVVAEAKPGDVINRRISLTNNTNENTSVRIFSIDAKENFEPGDEGFLLASESSEVKNVGKWIDLFEKNIDLVKDAHTLVDFSITIPEDIEYGNYAGGIVMDVIEKEKNTNTAAGMSVDIHKAIRVYIKVTDDPVNRELIPFEDRVVLTKKMGMNYVLLALGNLIFILGVGFVYYPKKK